MNGKYLLFQLFFMISVIINLFLEEHLYLKILLIVLLLLYGLLILPEFIYNKEKFLFTSTGFMILSILFLIAGYTINITYMIILSCMLVAFLYFSKMLFNTTYGEVIISTPKTTQVKIKDVFYNLNKIYTIETTKKPALKSLVLLKLDTKLPRKPIEIIKILCDNSKNSAETSKTQKTRAKRIIRKKNTSISKKKKKK